MAINTETSTTDQGAGTKILEYSALNDSTSQGSGVISEVEERDCEKPEVEDDYKQTEELVFPRPGTGAATLNSQQLRQRA